MNEQDKAPVWNTWNQWNAGTKQIIYCTPACKEAEIAGSLLVVHSASGKREAALDNIDRVVFLGPPSCAASVLYKLAKHFINHRHDLMHKATGWMLREAGKCDREALRRFLALFHKRLPRTALRYAIEHMDREERAKWMAK